MPLRPACADDLPAITAIYAAAFYDEEFVGALMHPQRQAYPQDYHRYWDDNVTEWYWDYSHQLMVTYIVEQIGEDKREVVTGVGDWIRHGQGCEGYWGVWGKWDPRVSVDHDIGNMIKRLFMLCHHILSYWRPNRAANPAIQDMIPMIFTRINHLWSGRRATGWYLNYLAVHPAHQNQRYGRVLATWGVERAKEENVAASVISALGKNRFYRRFGFEILGGRVSDGEDNPMKGKTEGGSVLFCDPIDE